LADPDADDWLGKEMEMIVGVAKEVGCDVELINRCSYSEKV
jgi:hypothetical protein